MGRVVGVVRRLARVGDEEDRAGGEVVVGVEVAAGPADVAQGGVKRRRRDRRGARESLERALALFEDLGARLWAAQSRAELDRLRSRRAAGELTAAEQRVAELAAEGQSNKEIAAALFVSVHTVELHLSHAYAKLGVRSRAQLAHRLGSR